MLCISTCHNPVIRVFQQNPRRVATESGLAEPIPPFPAWRRNMNRAAVLIRKASTTRASGTVAGVEAKNPTLWRRRDKEFLRK